MFDFFRGVMHGVEILAGLLLAFIPFYLAVFVSLLLIRKGYPDFFDRVPSPKNQIVFPILVEMYAKGRKGDFLGYAVFDGTVIVGGVVYAKKVDAQIALETLKDGA